METKRLNLEWKAESEGTFRAVFSTFNAIDHDGDLTLPGAFTKGQNVRIAQWGHAWDKTPIGRGTIDADESQAWVDGQLFLGTTHGRDHYETIKGLGDLQEWSYGFDVDRWSAEERDGRQIRILESLNVHEVSPVMLGAGIGTHTVAIKHQDDTDETHPHHGDDETADLRKVAEMIGQLNADARSPEAAKAYAHLARHMREAGLEPLELRGKSLTFADDAYQVLARLVAFRTRTEGIRDLRAKDGRTLSASTRSQLGSALDALRGLQGVAAEIEQMLGETGREDDGKALDVMRARLRAAELSAQALAGS